MKHLSSLLRLFALLLTLVLLFSFAACTNSGENGESTEESTEESGSTESSSDSSDGTESQPEPSVDASLPVKVTVLNGTTGFGIAKLMQDSSNGDAALNYTFSVEANAANITAALINGSVDIAALPTSAAATVFNKTNGAVQVLALNTLGVLYVVTSDGSSISDFAALEGKTVYCPEGNPAVIFSALCEENGLTVGTDIIVDTSYAEPAALRSAVVTGEAALAVLPEPMVTIAQKANSAVTVSLDLTEEWDKCFPAGSLAQGCVVVRTAFAEAHPAEIAAFLAEYEASIRYMQENVSETAEIIVSQGIFAGAAAVAAAAIPKCNVTFVSGSDMKSALIPFYEAIYAISPSSIGGALPTDPFYYGAE